MVAAPTCSRSRVAIACKRHTNRGRRRGPGDQWPRVVGEGKGARRTTRRGRPPASAERGSVPRQPTLQIVEPWGTSPRHELHIAAPCEGLAQREESGWRKTPGKRTRRLLRRRARRSERTGFGNEHSIRYASVVTRSERAVSESRVHLFGKAHAMRWGCLAQHRDLIEIQNADFVGIEVQPVRRGCAPNQ